MSSSPPLPREAQRGELHRCYGAAERSAAARRSGQQTGRWRRSRGLESGLLALALALALSSAPIASGEVAASNDSSAPNSSDESFVVPDLFQRLLPAEQGVATSSESTGESGSNVSKTHLYFYDNSTTCESGKDSPFSPEVYSGTLTINSDCDICTAWETEAGSGVYNSYKMCSQDDGTLKWWWFNGTDCSNPHQAFAAYPGYWTELRRANGEAYALGTCAQVYFRWSNNTHATPTWALIKVYDPDGKPSPNDSAMVSGAAGLGAPGGGAAAALAGAGAVAAVMAALSGGAFASPPAFGLPVFS